VGSEAVQHPYDGDGVVVGISMREGKAFLRSRYVQTPE
jgi:all-trans-8'-apo-beta-carotenal 15,15'-oxygenase